MRMVVQLRQTLRVALPHGSPLEADVWERRHRGIVVLLWLHAVGTPVFGVVRGVPLWHGASEGAILAVCALAAGQRSGSRRQRACVAVFGLITASALLVHLSGGSIEMHFHFFVMVSLITLYQDWVPFGVALAYVVLHHGVLGYLAPTAVFSHPARAALPGAVGADPRRVRAGGVRGQPGDLAPDRAAGQRDQPPGQPAGGAGAD